MRLALHAYIQDVNMNSRQEYYYTQHHTLHTKYLHIYQTYISANNITFTIFYAAYKGRKKSSLYVNINLPSL